MKAKTIVRKTILILGPILLYLLFSYSMFLGLQVKPMYGNIGVILSVALLCLYLYYAFRIK